MGTSGLGLREIVTVEMSSRGTQMADALFTGCMLKSAEENPLTYKNGEWIKSYDGLEDIITAYFNGTIDSVEAIYIAMHRAKVS